MGNKHSFIFRPESVTCLKLPLWSLPPFSLCFMAVSIAELLYLKEKAVVFFGFMHYMGAT